jgi:cytochrome c553
MRILLITAAVLGALLLASPAAQAKGDPAAGATKSQTCVACHGKDGNGAEPPLGMYPKLGGQYRDYLVYALESYRNGTRSNAIMQGFANALSDQDIEDLAAYFAAQKPGVEDLSHIK